MKFLRKINLEIDKDIYNPIQVKQSDNARYLLFRILDNGVPFSLENKTVRCFGKKPDGKEIYNDMSITNATKGECELRLTSGALSVPGILQLEIEMKENEDILSTFLLDVDVKRSLRSNSSIESSNEFTALENGIIKLDEWDKYFEETSGAIEEKYTERLNGLATSLEDKVNKEQGKGLSTNDYTDAEQKEVSTIKNKADTTRVDELERQIGQGVTDEQLKNAVQSKVDDGTINTIQVGQDGIDTFNIRRNAVNIDLVDFIDKSINVFNKDSKDNLINKYINSSGVISEANDYTITHFIYVKKGDIIRRNLNTNEDLGGGLYDKNGRFIKKIGKGVVNNDVWEYTVEENDVEYARLNLHWNATTNINTIMITINNYIPEEYCKFSVSLDKNIQILLPHTNNPLNGKKMCCNGTSIMYGAGYNGGFAKIIADRNNMQLVNNAVSGGTICSGTVDGGGNNKHWISTSMKDLPTDGDYYIFEGWVNDCNSSTNMGKITWGYENELDTTTFCGAFELCCKTLIEKFHGKKVGYIFVHRIWQPTDTLAESFYNNIITILKKWGIPYLDLMNEIPSLNLIGNLKQTYTNNADGWHPNKEGYEEYYCDKIEAWLKTL